MDTSLLIFWLFQIPTVFTTFLWLLSHAIDFWTRGRTDLMLGENFTRWWHSLLFGKVRDYDWRTDYADGFNPWAVMTTIFAALGSLVGVAESIGVLPDVFFILGAAGLCILPRYLLDICNSIRYSFKTRKSEDIEHLKAEVERINRVILKDSQK